MYRLLQNVLANILDETCCSNLYIVQSMEHAEVNLICILLIAEKMSNVVFKIDVYLG
jgi:hypothetical protein